MKRRANGEGFIRQRADGRWECQIVLPTGERKSLYARSQREVLERAGLPRIRFHELRHTAASIALANGVPTKIVSEMLGHASTSITDEIYAHVTPTMQQATASMFDKVLGGAR